MFIFLYKSLFFLFLGYILVGCAGNTEPLPSQTTTDNKDSTKLVKIELSCRFVEVQMPNSRLRSTPDLQGAVVEVFGINAILRYMDDSTRFTTEVEMKGKKVQAHWYKCRSGNGNEGWMYGGILRFLSEEENSRFAASCLPELPKDSAQKAMTNSNNPKKPKKIETVTQATVDQYQNYLKKLNTSQFESVGTAVNNYELALANANEPTCDAAFAIFWKFMETVRSSVANKYNFNQYNRLSTDISRYGRATMREDSFLYRLSTHGFDLGAADNKVFLRVDMDYLMRHFYRFVSPAVQSFLEESKKEMQEPLAQQKLTEAQTKEIANRTIFWEKLLSQYPNFVMYNESKAAYQSNLNLLLKGNAQSPPFTYGSLSDNFKKAYLYTQEQHKGTNTQLIISEYWILLSGQNFKDNEVSRRFRTEKTM